MEASSSVYSQCIQGPFLLTTLNYPVSISSTQKIYRPSEQIVYKISRPPRKAIHQSHPTHRRAFLNNRPHGPSLHASALPSGIHDPTPAITRRSGCGIVASTLEMDRSGQSGFLPKPAFVEGGIPAREKKTYLPSLLVKPAMPNGDPLGLAGYASVGSRRLSR